uniref:Carbonic anhydrase n=1 Tax=Phallusia mammillata TaxID=59560 RepID=A0A6F9DJ08_9ASCI|nr:uncharacterized protein LOC100185503 [Phallusia mammillata]
MLKRILLLIFVFLTVIEGSEWKYKGTNGPQDWDAIAPACGSTAQSPIDIDTGEVVPDEALHFLEYTGYDQSLAGGKIFNNGHTVQLNFPGGKEFKLSGMGFNGTYTALQLHFHWRAANSTIDGGSEHSVNEKYYDAEMHIVHIKDPYTSTDEIKNMSNGLAVIGVFLEVSDSKGDNPFYENLLDAAAQCKAKGDEFTLEKDVFPISLLPSCGSYYRYFGSLTTPPCYEAVQWTLYKNPVTISNRQLKLLQSLRVNQASSTTTTGSEAPLDGRQHGNDDDDLSDNFRPTQPLNGRVVTAFYDIDVAENTGGGEWHYQGSHGPDNWSDNDEECSKNKQSPVNFKTDAIQPADSYNKLEFSSSYSSETTGSLVNNGHSVMFAIHNEMEFEDGEKKFVAQQLHFHWGSAKIEGSDVVWNEGSEHTVNGFHYPIEMHIVHGNDDAEGDDDHSDDLAVLGVFFYITKDKNLVSEKADEQLEKLTSYFPQTQYKDENVDVDVDLTLMDLLPTNKSYYRYSGSLTTPPCSESVVWSVFSNPVYVSYERFLAFQTLYKVERHEIKDGNGTMSVQPSDVTMDDRMKSVLLVNNYRPVQDLGSRVVVINIQPPASSDLDVAAIVLWTLLGAAVFVALLAVMLFCRNKRSSHKQAKYSEGKLTEESKA